MTDPINVVNISAIERKATQEEFQVLFASQEDSETRLTESIEQAFNPGAVERAQARNNRFQRIEQRRKPQTEEARLIKGVEARSEEDLARNYNRRNQELPADILRALRQSLRNNLSAEEVLKNVTDVFSDVTLADEALEFLDKSTTGFLNNSVKKAREILNETKGREIIAGRNVDTVAKSFHKKGIGENPTELRELYRDVTGNPRDHNTLFSELSAKYDFDQLKLVVAFLLKGLAFDMKSKGPSIQQAELMILMTDVRNLQSILWVYLFFKSRMKLMRSLYKSYGLTTAEKISFQKLAKEFIKLVEERYPSVLKIMKQLEQFDILDDMEKVVVLMQFRDAIRQLSPRLYQSIRHRQDLLLVILEALEELEGEEEEEENDSV